MSKDDLKPCPFCGADAIVEKVGGYPHGYDVHCINDDCHCSLIYHETHHHAVKAWNTRTHNIQSYILGEQDAAEGLANLFEHYGYERAAKDIREEAAKWLTQENREIVSGRYRAEAQAVDVEGEVNLEELTKEIVSKISCGIPVKVNTNMPKDSIMLSTPTDVAYSNGKYVAKIQKEALVTYTDELKAKMAIQVRNLLFEYKFGVDDPDKFMKRGHVPVEHVQKLMFLYADLIIKEVFKEV